MRQSRPRFHFSPAVGWINDPNGLIEIDGVFHIFYQANPHALVHGPMHWGHASSRDLVTWDEHVIALYPDVDGQCFSGSAIAAGEGRVPEALGGQDAVLLFYTAHLDRPGQKSIESQSVAIADRALGTFRKFSGNPVIANPGIQDFRDPKVIWRQPTQRWIMVVTHGQSVGIYASADALSWRFESEFGAREGRHSKGPWECPDLFPVQVAGTGETIWILVVGLGSGHVSSGSGTQYFVGDFDGTRFVNRNRAETELFLDWGRDYYATQSFSGTGGSAPLTIAWMSNWAYANHTPATEFRGSMTLPRRLTLVETRAGLRLAQAVDPSAAKAFATHAISTGELRPASGTYRLSIGWPETASRLDLSLFGEASPSLVVERAGADRYVARGIRAAHPEIPAGRDFETDFSFDIAHRGPLDIEVFVDNGLVEMGFAGGLHWFSALYFPQDPGGAVRLTAG